MLYQGVQTGHMAGEYWQTGFYFRSVSLSLEGARNVFSATMQQLFTTPKPSGSAYINFMDLGDSIDDSWVYQVDESTDRRVSRSITSTGTVTGTSALNVPPRREGPLVLFYPSPRTGSVGRMYLPRISVSFMQGGDLHPSFAPTVKYVVDQALAYLASQSATLVIRSRRLHTDQPAATHLLSLRLGLRNTRTADAPPSYL